MSALTDQFQMDIFKSLDWFNARVTGFLSVNRNNPLLSARAAPETQFIPNCIVSMHFLEEIQK
jgi:hypothetical protein